MNKIFLKTVSDHLIFIMWFAINSTDLYCYSEEEEMVLLLQRQRNNILKTFFLYVKLSSLIIAEIQTEFDSYPLADSSLS